MKALVLANGDLHGPGVLRKRVRAGHFDLVVAADAGARHARTLNLKLDAIVGDMDSIGDAKREYPADVDVVSYPAEKNETDLELALLYAREHGADTIVVVGGTGDRLDMTVANVLLLAHPRLNPSVIKIWHGSQTAWLIRPPGGVIPGLPGDTISLIPLGGDASGVTTAGLMYALRRATLTFGKSRGVSNLVEKPPTRVSLKSGILLAVHTPVAGTKGKVKQ